MNWVVAVLNGFLVVILGALGSLVAAILLERFVSISIGLLRLAIWLLPPDQRADREKEWLGELAELVTPMRCILRATGHLFAGVRIGVAVRRFGFNPSSAARARRLLRVLGELAVSESPQTMGPHQFRTRAAEKDARTAGLVRQLKTAEEPADEIDRQVETLQKRVDESPPPWMNMLGEVIELAVFCFPILLIWLLTKFA